MSAEFLLSLPPPSLAPKVSNLSLPVEGARARCGAMTSLFEQRPGY